MWNRRSILLPLAAVLIAAFIGAVRSQEIDWSAVGKALGKEGMVQAGGGYRIGLPRSDLKVTLDGVSLKPSFALGGWLGFEPMGTQTMVMGDLVLLESEVNPVMENLLKSGIEITAVHNHLLRSSPSVMYMHVMGRGEPAKLAKQFHDALSFSNTPLAQVPAPTLSTEIDLEVAEIDKILGTRGKVNGGALQFSLPRAEEITYHEMIIPPALGTAIGISFQPTGNGKAAITGDFVLIGGEVTSVLRTLRENGIEVTALHSHMVDEQPRLYFMHFWANDEAQKLARGLKAALDQINLKKG